MKNNIVLFKPKFRINETLKEISNILRTGWTGIGNKTITIENQWNKFTGLKNSLFVNSATAGLHISVEVLKTFYKWKNDAEIITTPISFVSTSHCILYSGLKPVFCDIDITGTLDPKKITKLINKKTKAIIFVGLGGSCGNLDKILKICKKYKLKLILDAAHMAGAYHNGKHVGYESDIAVFSFQAVKNLPTADSGMVSFKNKNLESIARKLSWCGIDKDTFAREKKYKSSQAWEYDVPFLGQKYNGNSLMATVALVALKYLKIDNIKRKNIAKIYFAKLKDNKKITIVPHSKGSSRHLFSILVKNRNNIIKRLKEKNINPGVHYKSILDFSYYKKKNYIKKSKDMKISKRFSKDILSLPMHLYLTKKDINKICNTINNAT